MFSSIQRAFDLPSTTDTAGWYSSSGDERRNNASDGIFGSGNDEGRAGEDDRGADRLTQFPPYGTNDLSALISYDDDGDGGGGDRAESRGGETSSENFHVGGGSVASSSLAPTAVSTTLSSAVASAYSHVVYGSSATKGLGNLAADDEASEVSLLSGGGASSRSPDGAAAAAVVADGSAARDIVRSAIHVDLAPATGPWNDEDELNLWRKEEDLPTKIETAKVLTANKGEEIGCDEEEKAECDGLDMNEGFGRYSRPTIRDWSAAALCALSNAPGTSSSRLNAQAWKSDKGIGFTEGPGISRIPQKQQQQHSLQSMQQLQLQLPKSESLFSVGSVPSTPISVGTSLLREGHCSDIKEDGVAEEEGGGELEDSLLTRRHWMPDRLCRHCYACVAPFTVFRRRHHCRLCGQVFCSSCSAYFVDICDTVTTVPGSSTYVPISGAERNGQEDSSSQADDPEGLDSNYSSSPTSGFARASLVEDDDKLSQQLKIQSKQQLTTIATPSPGERTLRTCKLCYDQVQEWGGKLESGAFGYRSGSNFAFRPKQSQAETLVNGGTVAAIGEQSNTCYVGVDIDDEKLEEEHAKAEAEYAAGIYSNQQVRKGRVSMLERNCQPMLKAGAAALVASDRAESFRKVPATVKNDTRVTEANRRLGLAAAEHIERMCEELLLSDAPLLLEEIGVDENESDNACSAKKSLKQWVNILMSHASRACATVSPNVKKGDLLDIRPYCKVKCISGGAPSDCAYMSGVIFHKNVSHKAMSKEIQNPKLLLLSGSIEYTRSETQRMASLDTLLEQEAKYMEILVNKIIKLKPDLLIVGRSISRKAQELLLQANVALIQHVKASLISRIARQTGATILSSADHIMNQFGKNLLGTCKRFRLATFRDNNSWTNIESRHKHERSTSFRGEPFAPETRKDTHKGPQDIDALLARNDLPNHYRQALLAANVLGEDVIDGSDAIKKGLVKRGVALTYVMIEGCRRDLGCTVVLRGASLAALKQVKRVLKFIVNVAYNLRLETSYLRERSAMLPMTYSLSSNYTFSSSLCVDYGDPPQGKRVRPWNGGKNDTSQRSGRTTAFDHQSILITSVWMLGRNQNSCGHQCCPAEVKGICYYSVQDVSLGQFLRDSCFNLALKCQNPSCKKSVLDHSLSFVHRDGLINITVELMDSTLPAGPDGSGNNHNEERGEAENSKKPIDKPIATWTYCTNCSKVVTPLRFLGEDTWKYSFGKFLESFFYNKTALLNSPEHGCSCQMQTCSTLYFGCGELAARFTYEKIEPYGVHIRKTLPFNGEYHRTESLKQLDLISVTSSQLFITFEKHIERILRDARQLRGAANRSEHLKAIVGELNEMRTEVDHVSKTLRLKISSITSRLNEGAQGILSDGSPLTVTNEMLFVFPWQSRRYLFLLTSAWNDRLTLVGCALTAMRKLSKKAAASGTSRDLGLPQPNGDNHDEVTGAIRKLKQLQDIYAQYKAFDFDSGMQLPPGIESNHSQRSGSALFVNDMEYQDDNDDIDDMDYDEEYPGSASFMESIDADVFESRRRMQMQQEGPFRPRRSRSISERDSDGRVFDAPMQDEHRNRQGSYYKQSSAPAHFENSATDSQTKGAGGTVKSALTRLFNRGAKDLDPWKVELGILRDGRPRLEPGVGARVVPVFDDQPSTIIAYSLSSIDYDNQFKFFWSGADGAFSSGDPNDRGVDDAFDTGGMGRTKGPVTTARHNCDKNHLRDTSGDKPTNVPGQSMPGDSIDRKDIEKQMLVRAKSHIKHTFRDFDGKGQPTCKFVCTTYWATQFHAVRQAFLSSSTLHSNKDATNANERPSGSEGSANFDVESSYIRSLSAAYSWQVSGGKSGASFSRTDDGRFIVKIISRTELQMFLDCAPAYFEYLSKAFFHGLPTVLCKIVGVYQIGYHNRVTGKRTMEQVAVMQNIFHGRSIAKVFDLKGSLRGRFTQQLAEKEKSSKRYGSSSALSELDSSGEGDGISSHLADIDDLGFIDKKDALAINDSMRVGRSVPTLLDGDFLEFTAGRPLPLNDRSKAAFTMSILNDTLFLSIINVLDYSILVGIDEDTHELVVGIIDYMRQYDIIKQMERVGKSLPMVVGSEAPTIIQPPLYKSRFTNAMERYFMTVPNKWTNI